MRERKRRCRTAKLEEEAPFGKYAKAAQDEWAKHVHGGLRGKAAQHERGWVGWPKSEENYFRINFGFFEYTKALEICRRRFRRNFDMGIFS
jgi:hypothetical protein